MTPKARFRFEVWVAVAAGLWLSAAYELRFHFIQDWGVVDWIVTIIRAGVLGFFVLVALAILDNAFTSPEERIGEKRLGTAATCTLALILAFILGLFYAQYQIPIWIGAAVVVFLSLVGAINKLE